MNISRASLQRSGLTQTPDDRVFFLKTLGSSYRLWELSFNINARVSRPATKTIIGSH